MCKTFPNLHVNHREPGTTPFKVHLVRCLFTCKSQGTLTTPFEIHLCQCKTFPIHVTHSEPWTTPFEVCLCHMSKAFPYSHVNHNEPWPPILKSTFVIVKPFLFTCNSQWALTTPFELQLCQCKGQMSKTFPYLHVNHNPDHPFWNPPLSV